MMKVRLPVSWSLTSTCTGMSDVALPMCKNPFNELCLRNARADRLHRLAWESGKSMPEHIKEKLAPAEVSYYQKYLEAIDEYNKSLTMGALALDLTIDMTPPKELFIEVRVKQDYGTVMLPESGQVNLS